MEPTAIRVVSGNPSDELALESWHYDSWFMPPPQVPLHPVVEEIEAYIDEVALQRHPFFDKARQSPDALILWVSQELVMTNAFSQIVLNAASRIVNVHLRAIFAEVAFGEHGVVRHGMAKRAHPWLLEQLRSTLSIPKDHVVPRKMTVDFIDRLVVASRTPAGAAAAIGVGNERLIIPEYSAIKECFAALMPTVAYQPFLDANLTEDISHSRLCYELASSLIACGVAPSEFLTQAKGAIQSRVRYFDELCLAAPTA